MHLEIILSNYLITYYLINFLLFQRVNTFSRYHSTLMLNSRNVIFEYDRVPAHIGSITYFKNLIKVFYIISSLHNLLL